MARAVPPRALGCLLLVAACASAQTSNVRSFGTLTKAVRQAEVPQTRELRVRWAATPAASGRLSDASNTFTILQRKRSPGALRKERNPEISPNHLVIVVEDGSGREIDWRLIQNPRIIRAESPGSDGRLTGQVLEQESVEFLLEIPDLAAAERIQIYRPRWNGKDYILEPLAQLSLGSGQ